MNKLILQPLDNFAKLFGKDGYLESHSNREYHVNAVIAAKQFIKFTENPKLDIINQINNNRLNQITKNRLRLKPIVESVIFLGKQNIAFRDHRDDGPLNIESPVNEGNFRELLRFRILSGDSQLEKHLEQSSSRATYISKTTQNEFIKFYGEEVMSLIISRIKESEFYSIIFDETTDIAHISQMTIVFRYVYKKNYPRRLR